MDSDDEQLLRGPDYGHDADDPHPGPRPGRAYAELAGGALDGLLLDITGWTQDEIGTGVSLQTELGQFGPGGRALYGPRPGDPGPLRLVRRQSLRRQLRTLTDVTDGLQRLAGELAQDYVYGRWRPQALEEHHARYSLQKSAPAAWTGSPWADCPRRPSSEC